MLKMTTARHRVPGLDLERGRDARDCDPLSSGRPHLSKGRSVGLVSGVLVCNIISAVFNEAALKHSGFNYGFAYALLEFLVYGILSSLVHRSRNRMGAAPKREPQHPKSRSPRQFLSQARLLYVCGLLQAAGHGLPLVGLTKVDYVTYTLVKSGKVLVIALVGGARSWKQVAGAALVTVGAVAYSFGDLTQTSSESSKKQPSFSGLAMLLAGLVASSYNAVLQERLLQPPRAESDSKKAAGGHGGGLGGATADLSSDGGGEGEGPVRADELMATQYAVAAAFALAASLATGELAGAAAWAASAATPLQLAYVAGDLATTFAGLQFIMALTKVGAGALSQEQLYSFIIILSTLHNPSAAPPTPPRCWQVKGALYTNAVCNLRRALTVALSVALAFHRAAAALPAPEQPPTGKLPENPPDPPYDGHQIIGAALVLSGVFFIEQTGQHRPS